MVLNLKFKIILIVLIAILSFQSAYSSVNIISWWNYLDKNSILKLQKKCNAKISLDEYYSSDDFLKRYNRQNYSIIIFPAEIYSLVSGKIEKRGTSFEKIVEDYHPNVLFSFMDQNFSKNVAIFSLGISGFLYDPKQIEIDQDEDIKNIFKKAKNKKIAFIDDPFESLHLISLDKKLPNVTDAVKELKQLVDGTYFIITNDIVKIVKEKDFAFAYTWIGEGFKRISENPNLKFTVLPGLSYVSADLIASLEKNPQTECVVKMLASKEFLNPILEKTTYFSPYGVTEGIKNKDFALKYKDFINNHNQFEWLHHPDKITYDKMENLWLRIKMAVDYKFY